MRRALLVALLLVAAAVLVLFLVTATTGWRGLEAVIEQSAARAIGGEVEIAGRIRPALSSKPSLLLEQVHVASTEDALELEIAELLVSIDLPHLFFERELRIAEIVASGGTIVYGELEDDEIDDDGIPLGGILGAADTYLHLEDIDFLYEEAGGSVYRVRIDDATLNGCARPAQVFGSAGGIPVELRGTPECLSDTRLRLEPLEARVRGSDFAGSIELEGAGEQIRIEGTLRSRKTDLGDFVVDDSDETPMLDTLLPVELDDFDAVLDLEAERIVIGEDAIEGFRGRLALEQAELALRIDEASLWGGPLVGILGADTSKAAPEVVLDLDLAGARFESAIQDEEIVGPFDLRVDVLARGATVRDALASASGRVQLVLGSTVAPQAPLGPLGQDLLGILSTSLQPASTGELECAVLRSDLDLGLGRVGIVLDTPDAILAGGGKLDLHALSADLVLKPRPKRASLGALKAPILVHGPLDDLRAELDTGRLLRDAGEIWAFYLLNPYLAVVPLLDAGAAGENACAEALEAAVAGTEETDGVDEAVQQAIDAVGGFFRGVFGSEP